MAARTGVNPPDPLIDSHRLNQCATTSQTTSVIIITIITLMFYYYYCLLSISSAACPMAEHCRFYVLPPSVSVLCPSPGNVRTKVQGEQVCSDIDIPLRICIWCIKNYTYLLTNSVSPAAIVKEFTRYKF